MPQGGHRSENKPLSCILSPQRDSVALSLPTLGLGATVRVQEEAGAASRGEKAWGSQTRAEKAMLSALEKAWGQFSALCSAHWTSMERRKPAPSKELDPTMSQLAAFRGTDVCQAGHLRI